MAGRGLPDCQRAVDHHEGSQGRLAAIVTHMDNGLYTCITPVYREVVKSSTA
jgi:hypothetical protein